MDRGEVKVAVDAWWRGAWSFSRGSSDPDASLALLEFPLLKQGVAPLVVPSGEPGRLAPTSTLHRLVSQGEPEFRAVSAHRFSSSGDIEQRTHP